MRLPRGPGWTATDAVVGGCLPGLIIGDGPEIAFLPGLSFSHAAPTGLARLLEVTAMRRLAAHAQVYWVGRSPAVPPGTTMADLAEDYARAIRAHFGHPVPVVGFSTGGFLGLQLTVDHPEVVERLVVVGAAHRLSEQGRASNRRWVAALEQGRVSDAWKELARDVVSSEPARSLVGAALATIGPFLTPGGFSDGIRTAQAEESFDLRDSLDRISTPTLLVVGEKDDNCGVDLISETRNRIPGADLALLPGVGHLGSITDRGGVRRIVEFLGV